MNPFLQSLMGPMEMQLQQQFQAVLSILPKPSVTTTEFLVNANQFWSGSIALVVN